MKSLHLRQFLYSLLLIVVVPSILVINLLLHQNGFNQTLNAELQKKAILFTAGVEPTINQSMDKPAILNQQLKRLLDKERGLKEITVYRFNQTDNNFSTVSSTDPGKELAVLTDPKSNLAWSENRAVAIFEKDPVDQSRIWSVITPTHNDLNEKIALLATKISVADVDALAHKSFQQSLYVLIASVLIIFVLLVNHLHFIGYAKLYHDLRGINQIQNTFITRATHDLEQPVSRAYTTAQALANHAQFTDPDDQNLMTEILRKTGQANALMYSLSLIAKTERGGVVSGHGLVNMARIAKDVITEINPTLVSRDTSILSVIPNPQAIVTGDQNLIKQIIRLMLDVTTEHVSHGSINVAYAALDSINWALTISTESFNTQAQPEDAVDQTPSTDINSILGIRYWLGQNLASTIGGKLQATFEPPQHVTIQLVLPKHHLATYPASAEAITSE